MDQLKFSLGPREIFSMLFSGIPLLLGIYVLMTPTNELSNVDLNALNNISITSFLAIIIASSILGGLISGITWNYFKIISKIFRIDYSKLEKKLLESFDEININIKKEEFLNLNYNKRLTYMIKQHIGPETKEPWANFRFLPYIREFGGSLINTIDYHNATHIMYRNLSFGFLIVIVTSIIRLLTSPSIFYIYLSIASVALILSIVAFLRAIVHRHWWVREGLNGFYNVKINDYISDFHKFCD
jgi:hypothetical protein